MLPFNVLLFFIYNGQANQVKILKPKNAIYDNIFSRVAYPRKHFLIETKDTHMDGLGKANEHGNDYDNDYESKTKKSQEDKGKGGEIMSTMT